MTVKLLEKIIPLTIIVIFLLLSLPNIYSPGLSIDEADEAIVCDFIFKNNSVLAEKVLCCSQIFLFNRILPIMHGPYTGRVHAYLMFIVSRLFGVNVFSVRFTSIIASVITICFIYLLCKLWFGSRVAIITALLTATDLIFVQYSRLGYYREVVFVMSFFWAGFFSLSKYLKERKLPFLYLSLFLFGLGLNTKIAMLYYIIGLSVTLILLRKKFNLLSGINIKCITLSLISFCLGAFNLILYNFITGGESIKYLLNSLIYPFRLGYNNLAYFSNLHLRARHLIGLLKGNICDKIDWGVTQSCFIEQIAPVLIGLFFVSFVSVFLYTFFSKSELTNIKYRILFFFSLYSVVFLLTPFVPKAPNPGHLLVLLPFPQIIIAIFLDFMWVRLRTKRIALGIIYSIFLIPILVFNIGMNIYYNVEMKRNGGYRRWSTTIYELSNYLKNEKIYSPVTFGFGLKENIIFLTNYQVIPLQLDENYPLDSVKEQYRQISKKNEPIFFLTKNSEDYMPNLNLFMELAERDGKNKELYKVFSNRADEPVYWLYKIY